MFNKNILIAVLGIVLIVGILNTNLFSSLVKSPTGLAVADACDSDASCGEGLVCVEGKCQKYLCGREALVIEANLDKIINSLTTMKGGGDVGAVVSSEDVSIGDLSINNELPDFGIGGDVGEGAGTELECRSNSDCNVNSFCDRDNKCKVKLGNSVQCSWDSQCISGNCDTGVCLSLSGEGRACQANADCGENSFCNDVQHTCQDKKEDGEGCILSRECKSNGCSNGACMKSCNTNNDCNTIGGELCQERPVGTAKHCLKGIPTQCNTDNECVLGAVCQDKGNGRKCYSAISGRCIVGIDNLCAGGLVCDDKGDGAKCYGYGNYQGCTFETSAECATNLRCSRFINQGGITKCLGAFCANDNDCRLREQGYICRRVSSADQRECLPKAASGYCDRDEDCRTGSCSSNICQ